MTFSDNIVKGSKNFWELSRFCIKSDYHISGIISKLFVYFKSNYIWKEICSYADLRWSEGNVYHKLGFSLECCEKPNFWYIKHQRRIHKHSQEGVKNTLRYGIVVI